MAAQKATWHNSAVVISAGFVIGGLVTLSVAASPTGVLLLALALAGLLPALVIRPFRLYMVGVFLFLVFIMPTGKRLDSDLYDENWFIATYGIPSSQDVSMQVWVSDVALFVLLAFWLIGLLRRDPAAYFPKLAYYWIALLAWALLVSAIHAKLFYLSFVGLMNYVRFLVVLICATYVVRSERDLKVIIQFLLVCVFLESAVTLPAYLLQYRGVPLDFILGHLSSGGLREIDTGIAVSEARPKEGYRAVGTFGNYLWVAVYLELLLPLAFCLFWIEKRWRAKLLYGAIFVFGTLALIVTFSRTALVAFAVGLCVCLLLLNRERLLSGKTKVLIASVAVWGTVISAPFVYDYMITRPEHFLARFPLMDKAALMIRDDPFLGVGFNNHTAAKMEMFYEDYVGEEEVATHNHYLVMASEVGLFGLTLQLIFFALILWHAIKCSRIEDATVKALAIGAAGAFTAVYVQFIGDNFTGHAPRAIYFFLAGLIIATSRIYLNKKDPGRHRALGSGEPPFGAKGHSGARPAAL